MDHEEVREQLELAAAEPEGIDRLMAGDTLLAASIAAHLAGCPSCTEELGRLRRASIVIGDAVRTTPPPELKERTLAFVRDVGRIREPAGVHSGAPAPPAGPTARPAPRVAASGAAGRRFASIAAIAAAVVLTVVATAAVVDRRSEDRLAAVESDLADVSRVTAATLALSGEADAQHVALDGAGDRWGQLVYSPEKAELAVLAGGLSEPSGDREYRCWVEVDGRRSPVGKMFFGGDLAYWVGPAPAVAELPAGATFGVSLVDAEGHDVGEPPVLAGDVGR